MPNSIHEAEYIYDNNADAVIKCMLCMEFAVTASLLIANNPEYCENIHYFQQNKVINHFEWVKVTSVL